MKLHRRVVAVGAVAALVLGTPTAALAAGHGAPTAGQKAAAAKAAAKKAAAQKKAAEARAKVTFPGTVVAVGEGTVTLSRKERGVVVSRTFVVGPQAEVKRDGVRGTLALVRPGDKAVAQARRVGSQLVVHKLLVAAAAVPVVPATPTATIVI